MKHIILVLILAFTVAVVCEYHGFNRGFAEGEKSANTWWIEKKSLYYDTSEVVKKQIAKQNNHI
jgi:hypothetical protein